MREIDLSSLPKKMYGKKEIIDWNNSKGYECYFIYDDINGKVKIVEYENYHVTVECNGITDRMKTCHFKNCLLGRICGKRTSEFKIKIGTIFKDEKRDIVIIDMEYKSDNKTTNKYYKYKCNKCGYEGLSREDTLLTQNSGCACCCVPSKVVVKGINDITTTDPWMIPYFQGGEEEASKYTFSSHVKIYPICPDCGNVKPKKMTISDLHRRKSIGCACSDNTSYPEKIMFNILEQLGVDFKWQLTKKSFKWCGDYRYDFYLKDYNMIIETHGRQHFENAKGYMNNLKEEKLNDLIKKDLAIENEILNYVVIDCRFSELKWIKNSVLNSELYKSFDFSKVDWNQAHEYALSNLVKEVCEYYENNKDSNQKEIADVFKLGKNTVRRYLNHGEKLGWCFNIKERGKIATIDGGAKFRNKKVFCVELNEEFESATECVKQLSERYDCKFHISRISEVCHGKRNTHCGFRFQYI